jgi:integrase
LLFLSRIDAMAADGRTRAESLSLLPSPTGPSPAQIRSDIADVQLPKGLLIAWDLSTGRAVEPLNHYFEVGFARGDWDYKTYNLYALAAFHWARWLHDSLGKGISEGTAADLAEYRRLRTRTIGDKRWNDILLAIDTLYLELVRAGIAPSNPVERNPRGGRRLAIRTRSRPSPNYLTVEQYREFVRLGLEGGTTHSPFPLAERALVDFTFCTGLRREESLRLLVSDVESLDRRNPSLRLPDVICKNGTGRVVPIIPRAWSLLRQWIEVGRPALVRSSQRWLKQALDGGLLKVGRVERGMFVPVDLTNQPVRLDRMRPSFRASAVVINNGLVEPLSLWLTSRGAAGSLNHLKQILDRASERWIALAAEGSSPRRVKPHTLRHSFAVAAAVSFSRAQLALAQDSNLTLDQYYRLMINPMVRLKDILGHASVVTTIEFYLLPAYRELSSSPNDDFAALNAALGA